MTRNAGWLAVLLGPLLLLAACASPQQRSARLLDQRLQARLAPDIAANEAVLQPLPDGARVTLLGASLYPVDSSEPTGPAALDQPHPDVRASVIEALLDPTLMRVQLADTSSLPMDQRFARVENLQQYFVLTGLGPVLALTQPGKGTAGPAGLILTISVQCPPSDYRTGYGDGRAHPRCE